MQPSVEIETERLLMRPWRAEDVPHYIVYCADPQSAKYVGGPCDAGQAWRRIAAEIGHWSIRGFGTWALEERETGEFVGSSGLWFPEGWPELELGYWLVPAGQDRGYATEAGLAARALAYDSLGATTLVSYIAPDNEPSKRVAERLGAEAEATIELATFGPHLVYRHPGPADAAR